DHGAPYLTDDAHHEPREMVRPRARVREELEDEAEPLFDQHRDDDREDDLAERADRAQDARALLQSEVETPRELGVDPAPAQELDASCDPDGQGEDNGCDGATDDAPNQRLACPGLTVGRDGFLEAPGDDDPGLVERLAVVGVQIALGDPEHPLLADVDAE